MKYLLGLLLLGSVALYADSMEIKTGNGYRVQTHSVEGRFESPYQSQFPYVCYDKRVKVIVDGEMYLKYKGCKRFNTSCKRLGRAHFGRYPNDQKASQALNRCLRATPRFVD
jgi:hypothetical protein